MAGEFDMGTKRSSVFDLEGFGDGVVEPDIRRGLSLEDFRKHVEFTQRQITVQGVDCMDSRYSTSPDGEIRAKLPGGEAMAGFGMALFGNWSAILQQDKPGSILEQLVDYIAFLKSSGREIRGHDSTVDNCDCAACNRFGLSGKNIAKPEIVKLYVPTLKEVLEYSDDIVAEEVVRNAQVLANSNALDGWDKQKATTIISQNGTFITLDGNDPDPDSGRNNHYEEGGVFNKRANFSNLRDGNDIPYFQIDLPAMEALARDMSSDDHEYVRLMTAGVLYTMDLFRQVTRNSRLVVLE